MGNRCAFDALIQLPAQRLKRCLGHSLGPASAETIYNRVLNAAAPTRHRLSRKCKILFPQGNSTRAFF